MPTVDEKLALIQAAMIDQVNEVYWLRCSLRGDAPSPVDTGLPTDLIDVGAAAALARRPKDSVRLWCRLHPIDMPGGFAIRMRGRWLISKRPFIEFLRH